jgi:thermitase
VGCLGKLAALCLTLLLVGNLPIAYAANLFWSASDRLSSAGDSLELQSFADHYDTASAKEDSAQLVIGIQADHLDEVKDLNDKFGSQLVDTVDIGEVVAVVSEVPFEAVDKFVDEARSKGFVRYVEPRTRFDVDSVSDDPYQSLQWGLAKIDAYSAWNTTTGDSNVVVAVVDTGIDYNHPDLAPNYLAVGYDWVNDDWDPMDDNGHGTHCAGIIAAALNNSVGIAGVAQVRIISEKGISGYGWGYSDDLAKAICHAANQSAKIISCSWGSCEDSELIHDAIRYACEAGALVIASAGNDAWDLKNYPAAYEEVVAVAATDQYDEPTGFSNYGDWIELSAPGSYIFSTVIDSAYAYKAGTSMAAPCVAGVAALVWSRFPNMTRDQVRQQLSKTSDDPGDAGFDIHFGYGRVNAKMAVEQMWPQNDIMILEWQKKSVTIFCEPEEQLMINATLFNFGIQSQGNATARMLVNGTAVGSKEVGLLESGKSETFHFLWDTSHSEGLYNVTVYAVPIADETILDNNALSLSVRVRIPKTIEVEDNLSIQDAIDSAYPGDTVQVAAGTFDEHLTINKSLSLIGGVDGTTIIDGDGTGTVVHIIADNVTLNGFTVQNGENGICLECCDGNIIVNNRILNSVEGVVLLHSGYNVLRSNFIAGNRQNLCLDGDFTNYVPSQFMQDVDSSNTVDGKPIYYWINQRDKQVPTDAGFVAVVSSTNVTVENLDVSKNGQGILFAYTNSSTVKNIRSSQNNWGILLVGSSENIIQASTIINNDCGIELQDSSDNIITENIAQNNVDAIKLMYSTSNIVDKNTINSNYDHGISLEYSFRNSISSNTVSGNRRGVSIACSGNCTLKQNVLTGNTYNFGVEGDYLADFILDVDTSNTVNGKTIYYVINEDSITIDSSTLPNAGYLAVVNCTRTTVKDLNFTDNLNGLLLAYTNDSTVENVNVANNWNGIDLFSCRGNAI